MNYELDGSFKVVPSGSITTLQGCGQHPWNERSMKRLAVSLGVALLPMTLGVAAHAATSKSPVFLEGACDEQSHIAEGLQTEDLTKRQSRFFCDSAIMINPNNDPSRLLVTFTEKQSETRQSIGFAGRFGDKDMIQVERVYLGGGDPIQVDDGACKIFRTNGRITSMFCGAKIDKGNRRTVPLVSFKVNAAAQADSSKQSDKPNYPLYRQSGVATCTCPGTSVEFVLDGEGGARIARANSNYAGFTNATRVKDWTVYRTEKDGMTLIVLDNGRKSRIMADPSTQKSMGFLADGGVSDMLCQILVKPR